MATMLVYGQAPLERCIETRVPGLADLVDAIGLSDFSAQMLALFDRAIGADQCAAYQMRNYELSEVASCTDDDAIVPDGFLSTYDINRRFRLMGQSPAKVEMYDLPGPSGSAFADCVAPQGILILGSRADAHYCVRILRTMDRERITESDLWQLQNIADLVLSLVARHHNLTQAKPTSFTALASLPRIQERIISTKSLSRREGEVCARILYGYSSCGIAIDLGIGKESVMTYRKRAYQHLGIGSQRELLMWYLEQAPDTVCN